MRFTLRIILALLLIQSMIISSLLLAGCGDKAQHTGTEKPEQVRVISTVFASYDFARQVAGAHGDVRMLVPPGSEIHSYEPTPQDILDIGGCDLFIYVGGESDAWVEELLASIDSSGIELIRLLDCVKVEKEDGSVAAESDRRAAKDEIDEHVWTSVKNAKDISLAIADRLKVIDSVNAKAYEDNAQRYSQQLDDLDSVFRDIVKQGQRKTLVFGDRFPFLYFARDYGLDCHAAFPGCSTANEPSAKTVASLIDIVKGERIPVVFFLELSNHSLADVIAEESGAQALMLHSCHNISLKDYDDGESYVSLMRKNAENLKVALS